MKKAKPPAKGKAEGQNGKTKATTKPKGRRAKAKGGTKGKGRPRSSGVRWHSVGSWDELQEDLRKVVKAGPVVVVHYTGHDHRLLGQGPDGKTMHQRFNDSADNRRWPLMRVNMFSYLTDVPLCPKALDRWPLADWEKITSDYTDSVALIRLMRKAVPSLLSTEQLFQSPDVVRDGCHALFREGGPACYCRCRPSRWCHVRKNTFLAFHEATSLHPGDDADVPLSPPSHGDDAAAPRHLLECPTPPEEERTMEEEWTVLQQSVLDVVGDRTPLFVFHHSGYESRALDPVRRDPQGEYKRTLFQLFNQQAAHRSFPLVQASIGHERTVDLRHGLKPSQKPTKDEHALAQRVLGTEECYTVQRVAGGAGSLMRACMAVFDGSREPPWKYCSNFGPVTWYRLGPNAILVHHDAESG